MAAEGGPNGPDPGGTLINGRFRPTKKLGSGSFGEIYMGIGTNGEKVAIKFEKAGLRCPQLRHEYKVYRELANSVGIGRVHHYGTYGSSNVMVMDILGASLEDLFTRCGRRFSLKTTLKLADQLLERVDAIHERHLIHRDIKPANFVMGTDTSELCFCIDFGLSKRYRNPTSKAHIPHRVGKSLTGTPRYASINNHLGIEQARRDDLEAIGYVLIYFLKGRLPWQGLKARNASRKYKLIMEKKQSTSINTLCAGCPKEFAEYLSYCRSLKFEATPNIKYLRQLFRDLYTAQGFALSTYGDNDWDWNRISAESTTTGTATGPSASAPPDVHAGGGEPPVAPAEERRLPPSTNGGSRGDIGHLRPPTAATNAATLGNTTNKNGSSVGIPSRPNSGVPTSGGYNGSGAGSRGNSQGVQRNYAAWPSGSNANGSGGPPAGGSGGGGGSSGRRRPQSASGLRAGVVTASSKEQPDENNHGATSRGRRPYSAGGNRNPPGANRSSSNRHKPRGSIG